MFNSKATGEQTSSTGSLWSGQNSLVSISALHKALSEQKAALIKKSNLGKVSFTGGSITVRLSLGKVFHQLELAYPHIFIHIYKQKVLYRPNPVDYSYQLCGAGSAPSPAQCCLGAGSTPTPAPENGVFCKSEAKFKYYRVEEYNWNYLDQHVLGYGDFEELQEASVCVCVCVGGGGYVWGIWGRGTRDIHFP